jgi:ubiquinone/menaquinone biosynthesis C-methylase UbiE
MTATHDYVQHVLNHYKEEAAKNGASAASTMWDNTTRGRELDAIVRLVRHVGGSDLSGQRLLEVGAGNGVLLAHLDAVLPELSPVGVEFSPDMLAVAQERKLPRAKLTRGDVRALEFPDASFDIVVTERCVINLMEPQHQAEAIAQIARVLRPGGHYICIEAFTDGHQQMNQARQDIGLPPIPQAHHNLWFDKAWFKEQVASFFEIVDLSAIPSLPRENFLSSHYFASRVLYPAVSKTPVVYNSTFVSFFDFLPPSGNFSPIQLFLLKRSGG